MSIEIIAEVAQGYQGDITLAKLLAKAAVRAGVDAVKFQLIYADELATRDYEYYDFFRGLEMPKEVWKEIVQETHESGVRFYFDVYGEKSLGEAVDLGVDGIKIPTMEFFNTNLVHLALSEMPRVFVSVGGISLEEIEWFVDFHARQVCFIYGFQAEPTPIESNNLRRFATLRKRFPSYCFGFMEHADGGSEDAMNLALVALGFGIDCIEKHISLDRILQLEDCVSALPPERFQVFVQNIRHLEKALGTDDLELTPLELEYRLKTIKVVVANRELRKGKVIAIDDVCLKRTAHPSLSSSAFRMEEVLGQTLIVDVQCDQQVTEEMFE